MKAQPTVERTSPQRDSNLRHVAETCCPPYERTLCGRRIGASWTRSPAAAPTDCVVCGQMERELLACPRCKTER